MAKKLLTNEQMLRSLLKEISGFEAALLRERLVKIAEITRKAIKDNPEAFTNPIVHPDMYEQLFLKIDKHLGFENDNPKSNGTS